MRAPSYSPEADIDSNEKVSPLKPLNNQEIRDIRTEMNKANLELKGTLCDRDELSYLMWLDANPDQREEAIRNLPKHLKKKQKYLKEYTKDVEKHFKKDDGSLSEKGSQLLDQYKESTGAERKELAKRLKNEIREQEFLNTSVDDLLKSPHFTDANGKPTKEAKKILDTFQGIKGPNPEAIRQEERNQKEAIVKQLRELEHSEKRMEEFYENANKFYEKGDYYTGELILETIIEMAGRYPYSPRMQTIKEWNERDLRNIQDHDQKQKEIQKFKLLRGTYAPNPGEEVHPDNLKMALEYSEKVVQKSDDFLNFTSNRDGERVPRKDKYRTRPMEDQARDALTEHSYLLAVKEDLDRHQAEQDPEAAEQALREAMEANDQDADAHMVKMKAIQDQLSEADQSKREENAEQSVDADQIDQLDEEDLRHREATVERRDTETSARDVWIDGEFTEQVFPSQLEDADADDQTDSPVAQQDSAEQLEDDQDEEAKVSINLEEGRDNQKAVDQVKNMNDTKLSVQKEGRDITNQSELQKLADEEAEDMHKKALEKAKRKGDINQEQFEAMKENAAQRAQRGITGQRMAQLARKNTGVDTFELGSDLQRSKKRAADEMVALTKEDKPKPSKFVARARNLSDQRAKAQKK